MPKHDDHDARLQDLRDRLYSRSAPPAPRERRALEDTPVEAPHAWNMAATEQPPATPTPTQSFPPMRYKKRSYRTIFLAAGLIFFVLALILSGSFLFFGNNMISGDNITIAVDGPFAVGGGEEFPLTITIANQNAIPIDSATLIVEYPFGTQSAEEAGKELSRERRALDRIDAGEVLTIPLSARAFGEENEEKTVLVSIEYRVEGSNATFFKEAAPLRFKISSSPVILGVEHVIKSASGQELELELTVSSNADSTITDVLVKAEYPSGFEYVDADPGPLSERDTWSLADLKPEEQKKIRIRGVLTGKQDELKTFTFTVGVPQERDRFNMGSVFTTQKKEIAIENPFLEVSIGVNGSSGQNPVVPPGAVAQVTITFTNSIASTIYDGKIVADISGSGLDDSEVRSAEGFFDSASDTITWDFRGVDSLRTIAPGRSSTVSFDITPTSGGGQTPQINLRVSAEGNRIGESQVSQKLVGTASRTIKVESSTTLASTLLHSGSSFTNTGPIPPEAEEFTTYTTVLAVTNGTNAVTDGVVTLTLPSYVSWLDLTTAAPVFSYNPQSREVSWKVGDLRSREERKVEFQVSVLPSVSQVGQVITVIGPQRFRATDRFTGTTIRSDAPALTSQLFADPKYDTADGRVAPKDE